MMDVGDVVDELGRRERPRAAQRWVRVRLQDAGELST